MVAGLILASGMSKRFGSNKLSQTLLRHTLLEAVLCSSAGIGLEDIYIVVSGFTKEKLPVFAGRYNIIMNPDPSGGISGSIKISIQMLKGRHDKVLIMLGDQPLVSRATLRRIISESEMHHDSIICTVSDGVRRNPALFPGRYFKDLQGLNGDIGANRLLRSEEDVVEVWVNDPDELLDIDTPEDLVRARQIASSNPAWIHDILDCL
ncbi:MAG: nucleotidyltransferase family protein [Thermoplasmataceae archaeon]